MENGPTHMNKKLQNISGWKRQQGAALIVGMVMMLVLTIIGLSAMQGTAMQEKMSGNMRDANLALQAGEAALRYVEEGYLKSLDDLDVGKPYGSCAANCQIINSSDATTLPASDNAAWDTQSINFGSLNAPNGNVISAPAGSEINTSHFHSVPSFVVEYVSYKTDSYDIGGGVVEDTGSALYRNTIKARGGSENSEVLLETIFARRFR
ncbi:type IV pilus assembly protein PilX [Neptunomonas qingdaonensis]|uniref:Type IV pilus assembly protein PilX n=2 Tax=Neptunomonas qingdaonensis TaxID=1045558 RepID=A0A1I2VIX0_9GAMM|nr:type IV pilus assembly protein PilX [Neptunomonas qingdaonensis]